MIPPYPSLFLSHGAPDIAITRHPAGDAFRALGRRIEKPAAIVVVSAHWVSEPVGITVSKAPNTIHDFGGFPEVLDYRVCSSSNISKPKEEKISVLRRYKTTPCVVSRIAAVCCL